MMVTSVNRPAYRPRHQWEVDANWPFLFDRKWDAIILDESHNLLASTANYQSKRIASSRFGAVMLRRLLRAGGLALALSGTPFRSRLERAWGSLNWCRPDIFTSFWKWAELVRSRGRPLRSYRGRYGRGR